MRAIQLIFVILALLKPQQTINHRLSIMFYIS